jgi:outer membrane cobalamin receptor
MIRLTSLYRSLIAATVMVSACSSLALSQGTSAADLRGRVVDSASKSPIVGATIDVARAGSTATVARTTVDNDGTFRVAGLAAGRYRVQIRRLGWKPWTRASLAVGTSSVDLGTISLAAAPFELKSVAVTEKRADVQLAPDRNTYVVRDIPTAKGGSALDVLRTVPSVDVDIDNVVSLRGNSAVTVQINGRPSPLKPAQLGDFLAQLPSDMVDKVEIIPNPSARDDPTGVAGIINIVLKQEVDSGTSGGATAAGSTTGQANVGVNAAYDHRGLSLYGSYGFLRDRRPRSEALFRTNDVTVPRTYLDEASTRLQGRRIHTATGTVGYKLTSHDDLSLDLLASSRHDDESGAFTYRTLDSARSLTGLTDRVSAGTNQENDVDGTLGFRHAFAAKGHRLTAEARMVRHSEGGPSTIVSHLLSPDGSIDSTTSQETQPNLERPTENSLKVDYSRPLSAGLRLETGYKGTFDRFHTALETSLFDAASGLYQPDPTRTSDFVYQQDVHAAYGMLTGEQGRLQFQAGLRAEHAATRFQVASVATPFDNAYNSLFPSGLLAWAIDDATQVKVSYSARIRRPDDADQLDPIPHYADPLNLSRGNPDLKPEHTSAWELGLQRSMGKTTLQVNPFFRRTFDAVRTIRTIDSAGVTTRTFANIATSNAYGADATLAANGTRLSGFVGSSAYRQTSDAGNLNPTLSVSTFGWRARANAAYRLSATQDLQALFGYQAPMAVEQGTNSSRTQFNLAARQKLMDDRLNLTLRIIDPFSTAHERSTTIDPRFVQTSDRSRAIRGLLLSASWTFGKVEKGKDTIDLSGDGAP